MPVTETPSAEQMLAALRRQGYRLTPQRALVLEQIAAATGHISADAVHRAVAARDPSINRSTVYRTLDVLERIGYLAHHHEAIGIVYHHLAEHGHLHLTCLTCGHVAAIDDLPGAGAFVRHLAQEANFHADLAHSSIFGVCGECAAEGKSPSTPHRHALGSDDES